MKSRFLRIAVALTAVLAVATGCGGSGGAGTASKPAATPSSQAPAQDKPAASATPAPKSEAPKAMMTIKLVRNTPKGNAGFFEMVQKKGFFAEEGLKVETVYVENVPSSAKAVLSGQVDLYEQAIGPILDAVAVGEAPVKIIGGSLVGVSYYIFSKKDITTAKGLEGRSAGMAAPKGFLDEIMTLWMIKQGADPAKLVRANTGGSGASFKAMIAGKVDSVAAGPENLPMAQSDPNVHVLVNLGPELRDYVANVVVARDEAIKNKSKEIQAFMKAYARGIRYAIEHKDETVALTGELMKLPADQWEGLRLTYDTIVKDKLINPNLDITAKQIDYMFDTRVLMGVLKPEQKVPGAKLLDLSFQQAVAKELGPFQWP